MNALQSYVGFNMSAADFTPERALALYRKQNLSLADLTPRERKNYEMDMAYRQCIAAINAECQSGRKK
jgi:hypothetical protein